MVEVPSEVEADAQYSEPDVAQESERLENLISILRERATRRAPSVSGQSVAFELPRARAAREMFRGGAASD